MSYPQFGFVERLMAIRAAEDRRWAEQRRLQQEAQASRTPAPRTSRWWLLSRIGGFVATLGERLHRHAPKQARLTQERTRLE